MTNTIDMQDIRYLNLFERITRISTRFCFKYNETLIFCVPRQLISKAVGEGGENIRQISGILRKRIKVVAIPDNVKDAKVFVQAIVSPATFRNLEIKPEEIILTAGFQNKATLIGRNKRRFFEMQKIVRDFFRRDFKIV